MVDARGKDAGTAEAGFHDTKLATGRYYMKRQLPMTATHLARIRSGAGPVVEIHGRPGEILLFGYGRQAVAEVLREGLPKARWAARKEWWRIPRGRSRRRAARAMK